MDRKFPVRRVADTHAARTGLNSMQHRAEHFFTDVVRCLTKTFKPYLLHFFFESESTFGKTESIICYGIKFNKFTVLSVNYLVTFDNVFFSRVKLLSISMYE